MQSFTTTTILLAILAALAHTGHALPSNATPSGAPIPANVKIPTIVNVTPGLPDGTDLNNLILFTQVQDLGLLSGENPLPGASLNASSSRLRRRSQDVSTFQTFTGDACDGDAGAVININDAQGYCIGTTGRHSFRITGQDLIVSADSAPECPCKDSSNCPGSGVEKAVAHCYNVNTGRPWESSWVFRAAS